MVIVETTGDGTVYVNDSESLAQIIVEVGVGQLSNSDFNALLAQKEDLIGNPSVDNYYLRRSAAGVWNWFVGYTHPAYSTINLSSETNKAIKSIQVDATGHVIAASIGTVESSPPVLEIPNTDTSDLSIGDKTTLQAAIVNYCASSGSIPIVGEIFYLVIGTTVSFLASKKGSITGVTFTKYEDGDDIYLRITNNSGDTLYFEYSLTTYDKQ